jgi:chemotaxis protein MotA
MATALLVTLYGALLANLIWLPLANGKLLDEETNRTLIIDGILMIRDSRSPALVREMLLAHRREKHCQEEAEPLPA